MSAGVSMSAQLDAAIFDFDGTLVDTMPLHYQAYRQTFADAGVALSEQDYFDNVGGTWRETIPRFLRGRECRWTVEQLHDRKQERVLDVLRTVEIPRLAASRLLPLLAGRVRMAIASSGSRATVELIVSRLRWEHYFEAILTGEDAPRGKPAPDLFLRAAERLEIPPTRCLVFEDTDDGIAAAIAAGMTPFDVRGEHAR